MVISDFYISKHEELLSNLIYCKKLLWGICLFLTLRDIGIKSYMMQKYPNRKMHILIVSYDYCNRQLI